MDWRHAYQSQQREAVLQIEQAARRGDPFVKIASRTVERPASLRPRQLANIALRDAEFVVNMAIHQHNEQLARRA
jgi:hypothetical protein